MKLSIIVPNVYSKSEIDYVSDILKEQNNQDFELILVVTKPNEKMYSSLQKALDFFGSRFKFIVNTKRKNIQSDIIAALHLVKNQYIYVLNADAEIKKSFVRNITNKLEETQVDILEFKPRLTGSIKWEPYARIQADKIFSSPKEKEFVAYSFPFLFNKVFKKSFMEQFEKYRVKELNDTKFATELLYMLLVSANSYCYWDSSLVKENISSATWFNPTNFITQFKIVFNYIEINNLDLFHELSYAQLYFLQIVLAGFLNSWEFSVFRVLNYIFEARSEFNEKRAKKYLDDLYTFIHNYHNNNTHIFMTNPYINRNTDEAQYLRDLSLLDKKNAVYKQL